MALPGRYKPAGDTLAVTDQRLLAFLVTGLTQQKIASHLSLSLRSIETRTARMRLYLTATTLYSLGVQAVRQLYVPPHLVIARARSTSGDQRVRPTQRQREMIKILANGATDQEAATRLGIRASSLRRSVRLLAIANGAPSRVTAGALFEALGWN